jgi:hypothetical protein
MYKEEVLGRCVLILFENENGCKVFCPGVVTKAEIALVDKSDRSKGLSILHYVQFEDTTMTISQRWFDLVETEAKGRLQWTSLSFACSPSAAKKIKMTSPESPPANEPIRSTQSVLSDTQLSAAHRSRNSHGSNSMSTCYDNPHSSQSCQQLSHPHAMAASCLLGSSHSTNATRTLLNSIARTIVTQAHERTSVHHPPIYASTVGNKVRCTPPLMHPPPKDLQAASASNDPGSPKERSNNEPLIPKELNKDSRPLSESQNTCIPLDSAPHCFLGDREEFGNASLPEFARLVNFPCELATYDKNLLRHPSRQSEKGDTPLPEGFLCCVMCGIACPSGKSKKSDGQCIPTQNKKVCTICDRRVWRHQASSIEIKWCKGCKNFRPWAAFGEKGHNTKCLGCRHRAAVQYNRKKISTALQQQEVSL